MILATRPNQSLLVVVLLLSGCGSAGTPPPPVALEPSAIDTAATRPPVEEEPSLEARWRSPFAVSSVGRTAPREPRDVAIIGVDPLIAEALAELGEDLADDDPTGSDVPPDPRSSDGDATTPADSAVPDTEDDDPVTHRVQPGDTLAGIARRYNVTPEAILEANDLEDGRVRLGQTLDIPENDGS